MGQGQKAQKQIHAPMHLFISNKGGKLHNGEKTVSLINSPGKTGS